MDEILIFFPAGFKLLDSYHSQSTFQDPESYDGEHLHHVW